MTFTGDIPVWHTNAGPVAHGDEIRVYAEVMLDTLERWVPLTAEAFRQYQLGGAHLSAKGLAVVRRMIAGERVSHAESGLSKREWTELMETLGREP
jgi:thymidylate synthase (FAD)